MKKVSPNNELAIVQTERPDLFPHAQFEANTLKEIIENYIRYYASGDGHTARAKRYDLEHFLIFLAGGEPNSIGRVLVSDWTMQSTNDFVDSRLAIGETPATVSRRLATIKHFGRTIAERLPGYVNPAREVKSPGFLVPKPNGLTEEELSALRDAADEEVRRKHGKFSAQRNRFLLHLLLSTGLRADEVRLLSYGQLTDDRRWCRNVKTKGRKYRNVYLNEAIRTELERYLELRASQLLEKFPSETILPCHPRMPVLISTYRATPAKPESFSMSPKSIFNAVADFGVIASQADSKIHLHPHRLRHTFAHGLLDSSLDIRLVAQALGHSDVRTTMRYTERSEEQLAAAIERSRRS